MQLQTMKYYISLVFVALFMNHGYNILPVQGRNDHFDCVEMHKQPAVSNPLLKDHKIQFKPTLIPKAESSTQSSVERDLLKLRLEHVECPVGTVPILRVGKKDFKSIHPSAQDQQQQHYSIVNVTGEYYGAQATMNVLGPQVSATQMSLAVIRIENANNIIQAGWAVAPQIYDDTEPHSIVYFKGDHLDCYNLLCEGFVQVDQNFPVGGKLLKSVKDGKQNDIRLFIHQDKTTKDWWLSVADSKVDIGYWPASIFSTLQTSATYVGFGGFVMSSQQEPSPPMGYGTFPTGNHDNSGYFINMQITDSSGQNIGIGDSWAETSDSPNCYNVKRFGPNGNSNEYNMQYGGAGGTNC